MSVVTLTEKIKFIERVFGAGKLARNSKNIDVWCPVCAPKDKSKRKLSIFVEDLKNHCWTCGYRGASLAFLIRKYGTREQLVEYASKFVQPARQQAVLQTELPAKLELPKGFKLLVVGPDYDPDVLAMKRYVTSRGISERDMWYFKLGYSSDLRWKRRVIMPSFDANGELNYFVGRAIDKFRRPKYDNPDVDKNPIIFNELNIDWTQRLVICEGPFDLVKCPDNTVPLLGSTLHENSELFKAILLNATPVALALDADVWDTKVPKLAKMLSQYDIDVVVVDTRPLGDPGSVTKQEFKQALSSAKPLTWNDAFANRLQRMSRPTLSVG